MQIDKCPLKIKGHFFVRILVNKENISGTKNNPKNFNKYT